MILLRQPPTVIAFTDKSHNYSVPFLSKIHRYSLILNAKHNRIFNIYFWPPYPNKGFPKVDLCVMTRELSTRHWRWSARYISQEIVKDKLRLEHSGIKQRDSEHLFQPNTNHITSETPWQHAEYRNKNINNNERKMMLMIDSVPVNHSCNRILDKKQSSSKNWHLNIKRIRLGIMENQAN